MLRLGKNYAPFLSILTVEILISGLLIHPPSAQAQSASPITPIQHVVVIFQENVSFDPYFATYPNALNPSGSPAFKAAAGTPRVNGLSGALMSSNPNVNTANGAGAANPFRLDRFRFEGFTSRYVWHCHVLEHEDNEMMRPYQVLPRKS